MPRAWIECRPERMVKALARAPRSLAAIIPSVFLVIALGGCTLKHPTPDVVSGKQLFVAKCGACHTMSHAATAGVVGPNLDDAFKQDRADGVKSTAIQGLVDYWIRYPDVQGTMPAMLYKGQQAQNVAAYVGLVAGRPGQDTGALASAVAQVNQKPVSEKNGTLEIDADPTGQLKFLASAATATSGNVTMRMKNASSTPHDIAITGNGVNKIGPVVTNGGVSSFSVSLKPGKYTFYCSVPGHRAAGMVGTMTVK